MSDKKRNGSYYTPSLLSDFLIKYIFTSCDPSDIIKILEPSCGDGQFIKSLFYNGALSSSSEITLIEKDAIELKKSLDFINSNGNIKLKIYSYGCDFLNFQQNISEKYSLIIGNPPYINKKLLSKEQIELCQKIHEKAGLSSKFIKNIWTAFLLSSIMSLDRNGILCMVLPSELLQVKYSKELRDYLLSNFERIEIFAFNELIFEHAEQDVIVLIGNKNVRYNINKGISFYQVDKLEDLKKLLYIEKNSNVHRTNLDKWTNYILDDNELNFINDLKKRLNDIQYYCSKVNVGIVTAANSYFVVSKDVIIKNNLQIYSEPILSKSSNIKNLLDFKTKHFTCIEENNKKVNFIIFPDVEKSKLNENAIKYINYGESLNLNTRYKCELRSNWFHIPSVWKSVGFFVKRSHLFPRIIINSAQVQVTDSFYRINMKEGFAIKDLAFSFYNSLTFILAELEGRYYGGGVLELTPNEFKHLAIPFYEGVSAAEFNQLEEMIENNVSIQNILTFTDNILLKKDLNLNDVEIAKLRSIYDILVKRRLRK